jgi:flagellar hook-length control protein FliK
VGNGAAKIVQAPALTGDGSAASATGNGNANSTNNSLAPAANTPATSDAAANNSTAAASSAAVAAAFNAAVNANGLAAANNVTPGVSKTPGGKDDQNNQNNGAADPASDSSSATPAQLPSLDAAQPVAVAISGNATANAAPVTAKTGSTVTDALKGRAKATSAAAPVGQNAPAQASDTDPTATASTPDSGGTDGSTSAALDATTGDNSTSTMSAQQTPGQPQTPGAATAALLAQIDFASSGGAERLGARAEATALNGAGVSAAPAASANATTAPNFGVFAANAMTTNGTAPAAAGSDTAVPVAGLAVAIAARAQGGSSQFDIRLDPPELGRIDVRLGVDGSGQVTTHVTVDRADTLQLLQSQQPQLQQALEQAGLKTADNGLQFTLRDQSFAGQNGGSGGQQQQAAPPPQVVIPQADVAPIDTAQIYARLRLGNGLDIRV